MVTIRIVQDVQVSRSTGRARAANAASHDKKSALHGVVFQPAGELQCSYKVD